MIEKKKICLVIPSLNAGGMERVMSELATNFSSIRALEVHLVLFGKAPELFFTIPEPVIIHQPVSIFSNKWRLISTLSRLLFLRRIVNAIKPHSILSFGEYWNSFVILALIGSDYPLYVSDRCQPDKKLYGIHETLRRILYCRTNGIIVQTRKAQQIYKGILPCVNVHVVGNPIRQIIRLQSVERKKVILSVGRLIRSKNHDLLIRVFSRLHAPEWQLHIVGGDAQKQNNSESLRSLITDLELDSKVFLFGSRNDVDKFYMESSIFVLTSDSEGFPNVIGEAMSAGLPVVAFDCSAGPSDLIKDGETGFLISLYDELALQEKLEQLISDANLRTRMGIMGQKTIQEFSISSVSKQFLNVILPEHESTSN